MYDIKQKQELENRAIHFAKMLENYIKEENNILISITFYESKMQKRVF